MKKSVSNYIILGCSVMASVMAEVLPAAIINYRIKKRKIRDLQAAAEEFKVQLNRTDRIVIRPKEMENEEDKIRTQWVSRKTGEVLNKKNIDEKIENETNEEKKRFYEYLKSEFLT